MKDDQICNKPERKVKERKFMFGFVKTVLWIPIRLFFPLKVYGNKKLGRRKLVVVMNHKSALDPIIMSAYLSPACSFMAKEDLAKNGFLRWFFKSLNVIFVKRGEADVSAVKQALEVLEDGRPFSIFPEGTRNKENNGVLRRFKTGAAFFALSSEAPIVPIAIEKHAKMFTRNRMVIGEEFDLSEFYGAKNDRETLKKATEKIYMRVSELYDALKENKYDADLKKALSMLDQTREERERAAAERKAAEQLANLEAFMKERANGEKNAE